MIPGVLRLILSSPGVGQHLGVNQHLRVTLKHWKTPSFTFYVFFFFLHFFLLFPFVMKKMLKHQKKMISNSQRSPIHCSKYTTDMAILWHFKNAWTSGAPWSCGHIGLLTAPRVGRSNPHGGKKTKQNNNKKKCVDLFRS